jgi:hypothetical protein
MDKKQMKAMVLKKMGRYEQDLTRMINEGDCITVIDHVNMALVEGKINALMEILVELDRSKD